MVPRAKNRRPFIVVDGPDCAGKTTLVRGLTERYMRAGQPCTPARNPAGTELGAKLREGIVTSKEKASPDAQLLAFMAGHTELVSKVLLRKEASSIVIFDRYVLSTIIYQGVLPQTYMPPFLERIKDLGGYLPEPELYIVLQATGDVLFERAKQRSAEEAKKKQASKRGRSAKKKVAKELDNFEGDEQQFARQALAWSQPRLWIPGSSLIVDVTDRSAEEVLDHVWGELGKIWPLEQDRESEDGPMAEARSSLEQF